MDRDITKSNKSVNAGVSREYGTARIQKWMFILSHFTVIVFLAWLAYFDGLVSLGELFGNQWSLADPERAKILFFCALLYWLRHVITLFYLIKRKLEWSEVNELVFFMATFETGLFLVGGGAFRDYVIENGWLDILALVLLLTGSFINSYSEIHRKLWKNDKSNTGHCYTKGLFRFSMHINYFGDTILFTGWCLLTYNFWTLGLPLFMAVMFIFFHIPGLDSHLLKRYGTEFKLYSEKTKKFIPFIF